MSFFANRGACGYNQNLFVNIEKVEVFKDAETNLSTETPSSRPRSRFSGKNGDQRGPERFESPPGQGA